MKADVISLEKYTWCGGRREIAKPMFHAWKDAWAEGTTARRDVISLERCRWWRSQEGNSEVNVTSLERCMSCGEANITSLEDVCARRYSSVAEMGNRGADMITLERCNGLKGQRCGQY
jgi:hypothetical protein